MDTYTERYQSHLHRELLEEWLSSRKLRIPPVFEMPENGYVAYKGLEPVAMAFIRKVEGGFGQLDGLVSNPTSSPKCRDLCIDIVVTKSLQEAKALGLRSIIAFSLDANTLARSVKHGFVQQPHTMIMVDLYSK